MKHISLSAAIAVLFSACQSNQINDTPTGVHKVMVEEVLQTSNYTYLRTKEGDSEQWLAVSKMEASAGETYYYEIGLLMTDFASKELNRTFKQVLFLDNLSKTPDFSKKENSSASPHGLTSPPEKQKIKLEHSKGETTIASLYENKQDYSGKTIKIKGQVIKFTPGIMNRNWIHIQDGTEYSGKFDLTVTTDTVVILGSTVTIEGVIATDIDLGYSYFYEVLMEGAKLVKQ